MEKSVKIPLLSEQHLIEGKALSEENYPKKIENKRRINCSGCRSELHYPEGSYCIRCPTCASITAVQELSSLLCCRCSNLFYFPAGTPYVTCVCGQIYSTLPSQNITSGLTQS